MSMISSVLVVHPDERAADALRYAFEREDARVAVAIGDDLAGPLADPALDLVVVGAPDSGRGEAIVRVVDEMLREQRRPLPVVYVGEEQARERMCAAGADEVVPAPALLRDVVTIGRLLSQVDGRGICSGELADVFGVYYLVRALIATRRSGVLGMARGLRRGELHIDGGEITSAQVGMLHGTAAFHQLLLWTEAQFELRGGDVLRRHEIPLSPEEVLRGAERFLSDVQALAPGLSPSWVCDRDEDKVVAERALMPDEVQAVLQLFDGERTVADVAEDSPYRLIDTFRIAAKLFARGIIYRSGGGRVGGRSQLGLEAWLSGDLSGEVSAEEEAAVGADWAGVSASPTDDRGELSPVVPALVASGEIVLGDRREAGPEAAAERAAAEAAAERAERESAGTSAEVAPRRGAPPLFTDEEEAFFARGVELAEQPLSRVDTFEDLASAAPPTSFWQRLFGAPHRSAAPTSKRGAAGNPAQAVAVDERPPPATAARAPQAEARKSPSETAATNGRVRQAPAAARDGRARDGKSARSTGSAAAKPSASRRSGRSRSRSRSRSGKHRRR